MASKVRYRTGSDSRNLLSAWLAVRLWQVLADIGFGGSDGQAEGNPKEGKPQLNKSFGESRRNAAFHRLLFVVNALPGCSLNPYLEHLP